MKHTIKFADFEHFNPEVELASSSNGENHKKLTVWISVIDNSMHYKLYYNRECILRMNDLEQIIDKYNELDA